MLIIIVTIIAAGCAYLLLITYFLIGIWIRRYKDQKKLRTELLELARKKTSHVAQKVIEVRSVSIFQPENAYRKQFEEALHKG
jgi:hypothetical protein